MTPSSSKRHRDCLLQTSRVCKLHVIIHSDLTAVCNDILCSLWFMDRQTGILWVSALRARCRLMEMDFLFNRSVLTCCLYCEQERSNATKTEKKKKVTAHTPKVDISMAVNHRLDRLSRLLRNMPHHSFDINRTKDIG